MRLPLVAVVGGTDRVPDDALAALQSTWRFARFADAAEVARAGEEPDVVVLAARSSRTAAAIQRLRADAQPRAVLLGFGEDSSEDMGAMGAVEGWVRLPVTAETLSARLAELHPQLEDASVPLSLRGGPPRQLGPFTLQRRIGIGSFGAVYEALDIGSGARRAIKIAHPEVLVEADARARWEREAALLRGIQLPGVVRIHGSGEVHGYLCLVMDLVPGESLYTLVQRAGPLGIPQAVRMAERLGRALGALHALGVLHRDIKPGNIVIDTTTPVAPATLVDLGLVRHVRSQQLTASDVVLGTAGYLSPERIQGGHGDAAADAYALAASLYFALAGRAPFQDKTAMALIRRVSRGEPAPPLGTLREQVPPGLAQLIDAMLLPRFESRAQLSELVAWCFDNQP